MANDRWAINSTMTRPMTDASSCCSTPIAMLLICNDEQKNNSTAQPNRKQYIHVTGGH